MGEEGQERWSKENPEQSSPFPVGSLMLVPGISHHIF
jgi:hypothetical protein